MALVPLSQYTGTASGRRQATPKERKTLSRPRYAQNAVRSDAGTAIINDITADSIIIVVTWEIYNRLQRQWQPLTINDKSIDKQWVFRSMSAAIKYVTEYMHKRNNAEPTGKKEYYITDKGYWQKTEQVENGKKTTKWIFRQYDNPQWDNGYTFFSQWIIKGKAFVRVTFEQNKPVKIARRDYHDPEPEEWSHDSRITKTDQRGQKSSYIARTYKATDTPDTKQQKQQAKRKEKRQIARLYDEEIRHEYGESSHIHELRQRYMTDHNYLNRYGMDPYLKK